MASASKIHPTLRQAYAETHYVVDAYTDKNQALPLILRIGQPNPALRALHDAYTVGTSTFLSASNPFSQPMSEDENLRRQSSLAADLHAHGIRYFSALGRHPTSQWPAEPSFLALGLPPDLARQLGTRYDQNAIVSSAEDAVPQLILLR